MSLVKFVKPYRKQFILGSFAKFVEAFLELYLPILMSTILDIAIITKNKELIYITGSKMLILILLGFISAGICQYYAASASFGTGTGIRNALMNHISTLSYEDLDSLGTSTLINRLTTDVTNYQTAVALTIRLVTRAPFICIGAIVMSFLIDTQLAFIFIALIPFLSVAIYLFMKYTSPLYKKAQDKLDKFALIVRENLSGVRVIRAFATSEQETKRANQSANEIKEANIHVGAVSSFMQPVTSIILNIGILLILYFGAKKVSQGRVSQGNILALTIYATKILYALNIIANLIVSFTKASASSKRIAYVLDLKPSITIEPNSQISPVISNNTNALTVNNITFQFGDGTPILKDVSFSLPVGNTLGIVGTTGAGKSTLVYIIQRLYIPSNGNISLFGHDLTEYSEESLRNIFGMVPQENILFSGTIAENISMGKSSASENDIIAALKTSQCWDFVSQLEQGIHSPIFEGGKNFSGGQKQRLTIARALVKNPLLLILDDSLSALDYKTDLSLRQSLKKDYPNLTKIIVSQRISSVIDANDILVLDQGEPVGFGTHQSLLQNCKIYQDIYFSQTNTKELSE